ncbi:MAG: hypothetical protein HUU50_12105 [Candidatus Brocadiae bacterium]|nr:hypothetical protein [Candidatus Brocadiia bacterium]
MLEKEIQYYEEQIIVRCKIKLQKMVSYLCYCTPIKEDLFCEAQKALLEAIQSFDPAKITTGIPCNIDSLEKAIWSYAYLRIKGSVIQNMIEKIYNINRYKQRHLRIIQEIHDTIMQEKQSIVTAMEIAQKIKQERQQSLNQKKQPRLPKKYEKTEEVQSALNTIMRPFMAIEHLEQIAIDDLEQEEDWQIALQILESLPFVLSKEILRKKFLQKKTYPEIAEDLGITQDKVRTRLAKTLQLLRMSCQQYSWQSRLNICRAILNALDTIDQFTGHNHNGGNHHED